MIENQVTDHRTDFRNYTKILAPLYRVLDDLSLKILHWASTWPPGDNALKNNGD